MTITIHSGDSLAILVTVTDEDTSLAKDITGATITAQATRRDGKASATTATGTTAITNAAAGKFTATFSAGDITAGAWTFQARVEVGGESEVVADEVILANRSAI